MGYLETVRNFVVENFLFGDDGPLKEDTSFLEEGIIDSTGILELIAFLEETYGLTIRDEEYVPENFDTLGNVARFLERKLSPGAGAAS
ncbi:MAG: acyl carrier protein [Deltaproteobacteria bacterium]|nr:acyl carrier protein [Deltaproteobacteria bacterium]